MHACIDHFAGAAADLLGDDDLPQVRRDSYRRLRTAIARINSYLQEHVSGMECCNSSTAEKAAYQSLSA